MAHHDDRNDGLHDAFRVHHARGRHALTGLRRAVRRADGCTLKQWLRATDVAHTQQRTHTRQV